MCKIRPPYQTNWARINQKRFSRPMLKIFTKVSFLIRSRIFLNLIICFVFIICVQKTVKILPVVVNCFLGSKIILNYEISSRFEWKELTPKGSWNHFMVKQQPGWRTIRWTSAASSPYSWIVFHTNWSTSFPSWPWIKRECSQMLIGKQLAQKFSFGKTSFTQPNRQQHTWPGIWLRMAEEIAILGGKIQQQKQRCTVCARLARKRLHPVTSESLNPFLHLMSCCFGIFREKYSNNQRCDSSRIGVGQSSGLHQVWKWAWGDKK